ncbi:UDP pyrophosphate phosphatase [Marinobacter sp.]|uniref:UDP pyrophosphate phosphatase n=1 Tax=Marinobacter sp. TaxID=50741 RepID=UPI0035646C6E
MIGGLNPNNPYIGTSVARERNDGARSPAARPEALTDERQQARPAPAGDGTTDNAGKSPAEDTEGYLRRVQARAAAEDTRLESFRADDIPMANLRALQTFATVASQREGMDGYDAELAGIDIRV